MRKQYRPMKQIFYLENLEKIQLYNNISLLIKLLCTTLNNKILTVLSFLYKNRVRRKQHKKRAMATFPLTLGDGIELGVSV